MKRPLVLGALAFILGSAVALLGEPLFAAALAVGALALYPLLRLRTQRHQQALLVVVLFLAAGVFVTLLRESAREYGPLPSQGPYWKSGDVEAYVVEAPVRWEGMQYAPLLVETQEGRALLRWSKPSFAVFPGQRIRFSGEATTLIGNVNFSVLGLEDYYRVLGVAYAVSVRSQELQVVSTALWSVAYWIGRLRAYEAGLLEQTCPPSALPLLYAVWLGQRDRIDQAANQSYVDTGTAHMLSVSGLHVAIVYYTLEFLLAGFIRRERPRSALILAAVFAYSLMAGARAATLRSAFVIGMYLSARFVRREPDAPTALGLAAIMLLLWNPRLLADPGALLSFASVASLICFADPVKEWMKHGLRLPDPLAGPLSACISVQVLTIPMSAAFFHVLPLSAPLANLIAVPLLDLVLWGCVLITLAGGLAPAFATLIGHAVWLPISAVEATVSGLAAVRSLAWHVPSPSLVALACYYTAAALPALSIRPARDGKELLTGREPGGWRMPVISASLLLLGVMLWKPATPRGEVDILDVGHGDAAAVFPPGGGAVLVDGGDLSDYHDYGREVVSPFLLAHGVTRLDAVFCTHPDRDHIGGLFSVLGMVQTARVILNPKVSNDELELRLIEQCRSLGIPVERLGAGDHFEIGDARFEVLHPPKEGWSAPSVNDTSIVMRLSWDSPGERDFSMLLTGDMEIPSEVLVAKEDCRAVILRAPHHGSATSSSAALIDAVAPDIAIASTRTTASRIAIGPGVAERYAARGIPLWRTDTGGGLRITGDPLAITSARATRWWATEPEGTGD